LIGAPRRTADFFHFDMEFLGRVASRIVNDVRVINRVVYDVTSKPTTRSSGNGAPPNVTRRRQSASVLVILAAQQPWTGGPDE
jgi:hypothetical protein